MEKPKLKNLTLPYNRSRSLPGHHLIKYYGQESSILHPKVSVEIGLLVSGKKILEGFLPYMCMEAILVK